jgi:hypothetical protein
MNRSSDKPEKKKPYEAPKLLIYGSLTEMTQKGSFGRKDSHPVGPYRQTGK